MDVGSVLEALKSMPAWGVWLWLFLGSLIEYLFPPFPGDTVVVAGAALVAAGGYDVLPAALAVTLGSAVGGTVDLELGRHLARSGWIDRQPEERRDRLRRIIGWFGRRGAVVLAVNRFFPGIRGLFFVAAGAAGVGRIEAMVWSSVSALAWNAMLLALGLWLGHNVEALGVVVRRWNGFVGLLVAGALLTWIGSVLRRRWR